MANLRLGEPARSLDDWNALLAKNQDDADALAYRAVALARLGKIESAIADLDRLEQASAPDHARQFAALVVAAEQGEGFEKVAEATELALTKDAENGERRFAAARGFSMASAALARKDKARGQAIAGRALKLLQDAVQDGDADFGRMDDDLALDPIRDTAAFIELMKPGHPDRRYAAVFSTERTTESISLDSLNPGDLLAARSGPRPGKAIARWRGPRAHTSPGGESTGTPRSTGIARSSPMKSRIAWPNGRRVPPWPWSGWAGPRLSGPCCGTPPIPGSAATSSTG